MFDDSAVFTPLALETIQKLLVRNVYIYIFNEKHFLKFALEGVLVMLRVLRYSLWVGLHIGGQKKAAMWIYSVATIGWHDCSNAECNCMHEQGGLLI